MICSRSEDQTKVISGMRERKGGGPSPIFPILLLFTRGQRESAVLRDREQRERESALSDDVLRQFATSGIAPVRKANYSEIVFRLNHPLL